MQQKKDMNLTAGLRSVADKARQLLNQEADDLLTLDEYLTDPDSAYQLGMGDVAEFAQLGAIVSRTIEIKKVLTAGGAAERENDYLDRYREGVAAGLAQSLLEGSGILPKDEFYHEIYQQLYEFSLDYIQKASSLLD